MEGIKGNPTGKTTSNKKGDILKPTPCINSAKEASKRNCNI
jgi:hypothetical protein